MVRKGKADRLPVPAVRAERGKSDWVPKDRVRGRDVVRRREWFREYMRKRRLRAEGIEV
jgi:hypothetical protein